MRIIWISQKGNLKGGAEAVLVEAAAGLAAYGHEVRVVTPGPGTLVERLTSLKVPVDSLPFERWVGLGKPTSVRRRLGRLRRLPADVRGLAGYLSQEKPDIVISNTVTVVAGALAARQARIPHAWFLHELYGSAGHHISFDWGQPLSLALINALSARVMVASRSTLDFYARHIGRAKLRQVAYSVEVPAFVATYQPAPDFRLLQLGTLSADKRPEDAVRAVAELRRRGVPAHLNLVGQATGDYAAILRGLAADLNVAEHVSLFPFAVDPFQYIAAAEAVVVCSRGEGFGRVTIEAMKLGKAVVGANSGATTELIRHGETGLLFELGSSADLADKLERLYRDPAYREHLGERGREWAYANYNLRRHVEQLVTVIAEVVPTQTSGQGVPGLVRQQPDVGPVEPEFSAPKPPRLS